MDTGVEAADGLPARPRLRGDLQGSRTDGTLLLRGGATAVALQGRTVEELLPDLLPKLDGRRTLPELQAELPHVAPDVLVGALQVLAAHQLLDEERDGDAAAEDGLAPQRRYLASLEPGGAIAQDRLSGATVALIGRGMVADALGAALTLAGVGAVSRGEAPDGVPLDGTPPDLVVLASDVPDASTLDRVNRACVTRGLRWLPATLGPDHGTVGPFVVPRVTACHECFRLRLAANASLLDDAHGEYVASNRRPLASAPVHLALTVAAVAAGEVVLALTRAARPRTFGAFLSLRPLVAGTALHEVLRLPRCSVCGPQRYRPQTKIWDLTADEARP
ncbi:TOMM precursor leader peptide-binding protein [Cellulomonas shaoxiangyii]|uniref:TOMM leader peptide-binding protein n=1 Tax=Cellulomonas shaoxiangyii TaxID=2566013 RepID=A0A4P7SHR0_9CELL|nr:TOMM precursor leader peptide-binding protein [Cellulomonas shaoxiangyii]QCB93530.1 TOMM precursor leader peptide-binding protein [Cellulomonas shaoxiangyii]TGY86852.1 TOMM precursor leader peptide-binding protein [Cellulomonas shaoxiangyii]